MNKLLQLTTFGLKNIEKPITLDFANQTINKGFSKINNIKGIFGYNGAGKTAIVMSMMIYKNIVTDESYLLQNDVQNVLSHLINKRLNKFNISCVFLVRDSYVVRHTIELSKNDSNYTCISKESIELIQGRTINEKSDSIINRFTDNIVFKNEQSIANSYFKSPVIDNSSLVPLFLKRLISDSKNLDSLLPNFVFADYVLMDLFFTAKKIEVLTQKSDDHRSNSFSKKQIIELINKFESKKDDLLKNIDEISIDEEIINISEYETYKKSMIGLENFIKIFKPELKHIELDAILDRDIYHLRRYFKYENYKVEFEYESSGIRQLVRIYSYLKKCSEGSIVFIDEMDVNINAPYFKKLVSYFINFGKGQLVFTTHNVEAMDAIKGQRRSISVIGFDGNVDTWVGNGNASPIKEYMGGYFEHSPMNVEDFDFISVFEGEN